MQACISMSSSKKIIPKYFFNVKQKEIRKLFHGGHCEKNNNKVDLCRAF